jgi:Phage tail assembly chaperone protein, TAC
VGVRVMPSVPVRHPELVSGSISPLSPSPSADRWMLKQVQHDEFWVNGAVILCGHCALLLGWRPAEFWNATPAELACVLNAAAAQVETPPNASDLQTLMELFPDAPTGGE